MYDSDAATLDSDSFEPDSLESGKHALEQPDEAFVASFVASMPESYARIFDVPSQREHAATSFRRGASSTRAELWRDLPEKMVAICVVAEDRPGLLSRISAALVAHDLDVVAAQAYGRPRSESEREAVDLFWIRRLPGDGVRPAPIEPYHVAHLGETLDALVRGQASSDGAVRFARALRSATISTRVRFEQDASGVTSLLVESEDRPGLLLVVSRTLYARRVQILGSSVLTKRGRVLDRFTVTELDGSTLSGARQLDVQTAVLSALRIA